MGYVNTKDILKALDKENMVQCSFIEAIKKQNKSIYSIEAAIFLAKYSVSAIESICSVETVLVYN